MFKWSLGKLGIGAIVLFISTAAVTGIIGNRADTLFLWLWEQFIAAITPNSWPWFIVVAVLSGSLAFLWQRNKVLSRGLTTMDNVVKLDFFDANRPYLPYRSFVSVPIVVGEGASSCLGVVCFDSENSAAFDPPQIQDLLLKFGRRIASALLIYRQLPSTFRQYKRFDNLS